jgi:site-specific DNA-methyltransferase (adenine-specific)
MVLANPTYFVVHCGDALEVLKTLPSEFVNCCITSPPYYGLRDYGVDGQIGLDQTPGQYVERLVTVFREMRRVLRDDGTFWLNIGDSYAGSWGNYGGQNPDVGNSVKSRAEVRHTRGHMMG